MKNKQMKKEGIENIKGKRKKKIRTNKKRKKKKKHTKRKEALNAQIDNVNDD